MSDVRYRGLNDVRLDMYEPALQPQLDVADVVVKTSGNPLAVAAFGWAAFGLFSVVMLDVVERRHEFAVRLAVGAEARHIVRSVLARAGWRALSGVGVGLLLAAAGARALRGLLFGVQPLDATTYLVVVALVLVVVSIAAYLPARRASSIDPLRLLDNPEFGILYSLWLFNY